MGRGVVRVTGRTSPLAALTVDGVAVRVQSDGSFGEYVRLGARGEVVVRATTRDGRVSEQTRQPRGR